MLFALAIAATVVALRWLVRGWRLGARQRLLRSAPVLGCVVAAVATAPAPMLASKCAGLLAMPMGLLWLALAAIALAAWWRDRPKIAALVFTIWVALTLAGNHPVGHALFTYVEGQHAYAEPLRTEPLDAVIVLGGGTQETPRHEGEVNDAGDRVLLGARLWHTRRTRILVTSGAPYPGVTEHDAGRATERIWMQLGIPASAIVRIDGARTTAEEARLHTRNVRARGWRRVGLVTSAFHMERALTRFRAEGLSPVPLPADIRGGPFQWSGLYSLIPNPGGARMLHAALWEIAGRAAGR